jgi:hypothetical protein
MTHAVQQILDAYEALATNLTTTGANVFVDRPEEHALQEIDLPGLRLYDDGDDSVPLSIETDASGDPNISYERTLHLVVEAVVKRVDGYGEEMRTIASEIETAYGLPATVGGKKLFAAYQGSDVQRSGEGDRTIVIRRMRFDVTFRTKSNEPDVLI